MKRSRTDGDTADQDKLSTNNITTQELGPSAVKSFGPQPGGEVVFVDISVYPAQPQTFKLRCGLAFDGSVL